MNKKDLIKTSYGYLYKGVAITKDKYGFSFGWISKTSHGRSYPDTLKRTIEKLEERLPNNSVEYCRLIIKEKE